MEINYLNSPVNPSMDAKVVYKDDPVSGEHIVGVKIRGDKNRASLSDTTYYYHTDKDLKVGDELKILVPTGGRPDTVIVDTSGNANTGAKLKELIVADDQKHSNL